MRCYHFNNFYLQGIQAGIQSAHAQSELAIKYVLRDGAGQAPTWDYTDWVENHKTMIILNGGGTKELTEIYETLHGLPNRWAFAKFHEGADDLGGVITNVAVVVPERLYSIASAIIGRNPEFTCDIESDGSASVYRKIDSINSILHGAFDVHEVTLMKLIASRRLF